MHAWCCSVAVADQSEQFRSAFHITLDCIQDPELRLSTGQELNKGESRNSLARAVFIHRLGGIRDRTYENQQHRASGLN